MCFHVAERFCVIFHDIHKKKNKEGVRAIQIRATKYKKIYICGGKMYSHTRTTQIEYSSRKKYEILMRLKIQDLCSNYLLIKSNRTAFSWMSLLLAPPPSPFPRREHSTLTFPLQARGNFLDSIFLTSESPVRQAFTGLSALTGTSFDDSRPVTVTVDHQ